MGGSTGTMWKGRQELSDNPTLRACLEEQVVPSLLGRRLRIASVTCRPSLASTSYDSHIVTVRLATGQVIELFVKNLGNTKLFKDRQPERRERELGVYRDLLPHADLDTARYHGSVWEHEAGRFLLVLELVDGEIVRSLQFEHWTAPIAWLARLHARFMGAWTDEGPPTFLQVHDATFFRSKAERAMTAVSHFSSRLARRLKPVLACYDHLVVQLAREPRTLVHGAYRPGNIILDLRRKPPRVCPVDWELAAAGSRFYDLAFFCDGFRSVDFGHMMDVYRRETEEEGLSLPDEEELRERIDRFRFYRVIAWLGPAVEKGYREVKVRKLINRGEMLCALFED
jgi:aminoglycoside phosphotransferase (APT) family kinase protein